MSAGTIFTELDLDFSKFEKNQQKLLQSAQEASTSVEKNWQNLGAKSDNIFDAMRASAENSYNMIASRAGTSAAEIQRAYEAMNAKITTANEEQFGEQTSFLDSLKDNWIAASAAVVAAWGMVKAAIAIVDDFTNAALEVRNLGFLSGGTAEQMSGLVGALHSAGVESSTVQTAFNMMSRAIEAGSPVINKLGISLSDANGYQKTALELFYETIDALGRVTDQTQRNAEARQIFGRGWEDMIPILAMGSDKLHQLAADTARIFTQDDISRAVEYKSAVAGLKDNVSSLWDSLARPFVLTLSAVARGGSAYLGRGAPGASTAEVEAMFPGIMGGTGPAYTPVEAAPVSETVPSPVGGTRVTGSTAPTVTGSTAPTIQDLQRAVTAAQTSVLLAQASALASKATIGQTPEEQLEETQNLLGEQRTLQLANLALQAHDKALSAQEIADKTTAIDAETNAKLAEAWKVANDALKARRITELKGQVEDWRVVYYDPLQADAQTAVDNQEALDEHYRGVKLAADTASEQEVQKVRAGGYKWDSDANQSRAEDYVVTEDQISAAREAGAQRRLKSDSNEFANLKRNYDDAVTQAINAELLKTGLWQDEGRKQLDIAAGTYDTIQARRALDYKNAATVLEEQAEKQGSFWLAMESGAVTCYASLGTFWSNVTKGFADTFQNVQRSLSDGFFDVLTGNFKDLESVAENFGKEILRTFSDILASATTREFISLIGDLATFLGDGSTTGGGGVLTAIGAALTGKAVGAAVSGATGTGGTAGTGAGAAISATPFGSIGTALYNWITGTPATTTLATGIEPSMLGGVGGGVGAGAGTGTGVSTAVSLTEPTVIGAGGGTGLSLGVSLGALALPAVLAGIMSSLQTSDAQDIAKYGPALEQAWAGYGYDINNLLAAAAAAAQNPSSANSVIYQTASRIYSDLYYASRGLGGSVMYSEYSHVPTQPISDWATAIAPYGDVSAMDNWIATGGLTQEQMYGGSNAQTGALFDTAGPRRVTVGEAGTETVAILRNPRAGDVGGGEIHLHFNPTFNNYGGIMGLEKISREVGLALDSAITKAKGSRRPY